MKRYLFLLIAMLLCWAPMCFAQDSVVICVSPSGSDLNDGLSWDAAKASISGAVAAASVYSGVVSGHADGPAASFDERKICN